MNLFLDRHQELLSVLLKNDVDFIIIGGYAVIYHGYKRTTGDVDIWLKPENASKTKVMAALEQLRVEPGHIRNIASLDFTQHLVFRIWEVPDQVDFITRISMLAYEDADKQKIIADVDGLKVPFMHLDHLVLSKISTGRLKDQADVEQLQKIKNFRKK